MSNPKASAAAEGLTEMLAALCERYRKAGRSDVVMDTFEADAAQVIFGKLLDSLLATNARLQAVATAAEICMDPQMQAATDDVLIPAMRNLKAALSALRSPAQEGKRLCPHCKERPPVTSRGLCLRCSGEDVG